MLSLLRTLGEFAESTNAKLFLVDSSARELLFENPLQPTATLQLKLEGDLKKWIEVKKKKNREEQN
jgi:hypothetical protein